MGLNRQFLHKGRQRCIILIKPRFFYKYLSGETEREEAHNLEDNEQDEL